MSISSILTSKVDVPAWALFGLGVIGVALVYVISWHLWFQFSASSILGVTGKNKANLEFSIKPKDGDTWAVTEANREVAAVQIDSDSAGDYRFTVLASTRPSLYIGRKFSIQRASPGSGDLVCVDCMSGGINPTSLPIRWRLVSK